MSSKPRCPIKAHPLIGRFKSGFTLLEILIVVAIIALLLAILVPALSSARKRTRRTVCRAYQYQLTFLDSCRAARLKLEAFDCGCYGEAGKGLGAFQMPPGMTEDEFRQQLEVDVSEACRSSAKPAS